MSTSLIQPKIFISRRVRQKVVMGRDESGRVKDSDSPQAGKAGDHLGLGETPLPSPALSPISQPGRRQEPRPPALIPPDHS